MQSCAFILVLCFCSHFLLAQNVEIEGTVVDHVSNEPISFAHISLKGRTIGTISNENGAFILTISEAMKSDSVLISHVSYEPVTVSMNYIIQKGRISLNPLTIKGTEITVLANSDDLVIQQTIDTILAVGAKNHLLKGFYRKTAKTDKNYTQAIEAFYWVEYGAYSFEEGDRDFLGIQNKVLKEGRLAEVLSKDPMFGPYRQEKTSRIKNETTFNIINYQQYLGFPIALTENSSLLALPLAKDYSTFYKVERLAILGDSIGLFYFKPRMQKGLKKLFAPKNRQLVDSAYAYINLNNFQLVRYNGWFSSIPGIAADSDLEGLNLSFDYRFRQNGLPESIALNSFSPALRYSDNKGNSYKIEDVAITSTMVFYDYLETYDPSIFASKQTFLSVKDDSKPLMNATYSPAFWEENQWLKRTPADEAFVQFMQENGLFRVYN